MREKNVPPHHPVLAHPGLIAAVHAGATRVRAFEPVFMRVRGGMQSVASERKRGRSARAAVVTQGCSGPQRLF